MKITSFGFIILIITCITIFSCKKEENNSETENTYIDVHCHLHANIYGYFDFSEAAAAAITSMNKWKIDKMILMPPPFTPDTIQDGKRYEIDDMKDVFNDYPGRFYFLGG